MRIYSDGREFVHVPYTVDFVPVTVEIELDGVFYPAALIGPPATILVAGPDAVGNPVGTVVLPLGTHSLRVRFVDNPETLIIAIPGVVEIVSAEEPPAFIAKNEAQRTSPCGWVPDLSGCRTGPCCPDILANPIESNLAQDIASEVLWALTGRRFGCCEIKVRPCKPEVCKPLNLNDIVYWDSTLASRGTLGVLNYFPTLVSGQVFNIACGCAMGCCSCQPGCSFRLPGPVCEISEVKVDGVVLPATDWRVYDNGTLVFLNDSCPPCQNYALEDTEVGTWSVTYSIGVPVPASLSYAAGLYACEIAKAMIGDTKNCSLPDRVRAVSRPGVDIAFFDVDAIVSSGMVGIPMVDVIVKSLNPYGMAQAPKVWSPDLPVVRREG